MGTLIMNIREGTVHQDFDTAAGVRRFLKGKGLDTSNLSIRSTMSPFSGARIFSLEVKAEGAQLYYYDSATREAKFGGAAAERRKALYEALKRTNVNVS